MTSSAARMPIVKCYLSQAMLDRLAPLADKAGRELGRTVERAAVIRTAMTAWLHQTKAPKCPTAKPCSEGADGSRLPLKAPPAATVGSAPIVSQTSNGLFRSIGER